MIFSGMNHVRQVRPFLVHRFIQAKEKVTLYQPYLTPP